MGVNALVTGLIVFRIFKVIREVQNLRATSGRKVFSIISVIIESGMILLSIQLARFVVTVVQTDDTYDAYEIIVCGHEILTGITPTIILVRVSMGLSFHDETLMSEATETLHFQVQVGLDHTTSETVTEGISHWQETRNDFIE